MLGAEQIVGQKPDENPAERPPGEVHRHDVGCHHDSSSIRRRDQHERSERHAVLDCGHEHGDQEAGDGQLERRHQRSGDRRHKREGRGQQQDFRRSVETALALKVADRGSGGERARQAAHEKREAIADRNLRSSRAECAPEHCRIPAQYRKIIEAVSDQAPVEQSIDAPVGLEIDQHVGGQFCVCADFV